LERTDNGMKQTSWPEVAPINQKNYYTDYMKRDDQILALRIEQNDKDRPAPAAKTDTAMAGADNDAQDSDSDSDPDLTNPTRMIVIHPGSQNLRIGFASDALPKTVPMVLANKAPYTESEDGEALPRRDFTAATPDAQFGEEWSKKYRKMSEELKIEMRANKHKVLPNSKDLVANYNRRSDPERIPVHNDPLQVEWTDVAAGGECFAGSEALRIPDDSTPKFRLWWPMQQGWLNEDDYGTSEHLSDDFETVIERAIRTELGLNSSSQWKNYSCIFIIPDLYDKKYVEMVLSSCLGWFGFKRVCFIQESMAATFGAGYTQACVVDVGAQKTSITCVEDGLCLEDSRINLKYGGWDVTETFMRMMLYDHFPYEEINLRRRYDWLLAEELKIKHCSLAQNLVSVQLISFHVRAPNQPTRKYQAKIYDEAYLACMGFYDPSIFDNSTKLRGRRKLIDLSYNCYEADVPDDPTSTAQLAILSKIKPSLTATPALHPAAAVLAQQQQLVHANGTATGTATPVRDRLQPANFLAKVNEGLNATPATSTAASPGPDGTSTPTPASAPAPSVATAAVTAAAAAAFGRDTAVGSPAPASVRTGTPGPGGDTAGPTSAPAPAVSLRTATEIARERDAVLALAPLDVAVITSITHAARGDDKKLRDLLGSVMVVGGGAKIPLFGSVLEDKLRQHRPDLSEKILVSRSARDMDEQVVTWKGASVFAKLPTNDSWITPFEYERLGSRILHHKVMWSCGYSVFLNSAVSFVVTDVIGQKTGVGAVVGSLGFADEVVALVMCPVWGLVSDRLGVRATMVTAILPCLTNPSPSTSPASAPPANPSVLAGLVGLFTGCGALVALTLFLPLPAHFGSSPSLSQADAVARSFYVVGAVALCVAGFVAYGLRGLAGEHHKGWHNLFGSSRQQPRGAGSAAHRRRCFSFATLLRASVVLGCRDANIGLGYLGGFVARASTVAISLFIPLFVNTFFIAHGFCHGSPSDPSPELKRECRAAYVLAAVLSGVAQTVALLCAPVFGYMARRPGRWNFPLLAAAAAGMVGYSVFPMLRSPEITDVDGRGGGASVFVAVALMGVSQIGAIVCSLGSLGRGVIDSGNDKPSERAALSETSALLAPEMPASAEPDTLVPSAAPIQPSRIELKGSVAGVYSWCGGVAILLLTKLGGYLFDAVSTGVPFYMMASFNAVLFAAVLAVDLSRISKERV
ncbi:hypothetical protein TD95_003653, partial [Thielaviopsis punctulata]